MNKIEKIEALKILDSRAKWTIETTVTLEGGFIGTASVPGGASVSSFEVKSVPPETAVDLIETIFREKLVGKSYGNQEIFDREILSFDTSLDKSKIGGNTLLSLSIAFLKASASASNKTIYNYIDSIFFPERKDMSMPVPIFNLLNGGKHTVGGLDFQEFIVIPGKNNILENIEMGDTIYQSLRSILSLNQFPVDVGDEGGFAPKGLTTYGALNFLVEAIKASGFTPGKDVFLGLDCASSTFIAGSAYQLKADGLTLSAPELRDYYLRLTKEFPIVYLEDPLAENSFEDWRILKKELAGKVDLIGDDLVATNAERVRMALTEDSINGIIVKPNQVGTVTETLSAVKACRENKLSVVASHRSGDTTDTFISDLAVGIGAKYLKAGAPARGERVAKYDRLLEIEKELVKSIK